MKTIIRVLMISALISIHTLLGYCEEPNEIPTVDSQEGIEIVTSSLAILIKAYNTYAEKAKSLGWSSVRFEPKHSDSQRPRTRNRYCRKERTVRAPYGLRGPWQIGRLHVERNRRIDRPLLTGYRISKRRYL